MRCHFCGSKLYWSNDFSFEDYGLESEGIVTVLNCSNYDCNATFEGYLDFNKED